MVNLYVNLTGPWAAQTFSQTLFWVHLGEFLVETNIWISRLDKAHGLPPLMRDELINQRHEQNRDWIRGNLSLWSWRAGQADQLSTQCLSDCWAGISVFFCSWAEIDTFSSPEYPACQFPDLGTSHPLQSCEAINIHPVGFVFWRTWLIYLPCWKDLVASLLAFIKQRYGFKKLFIYLLAALGLHCCMQAFSSWGKWVLPHCSAQASPYCGFSLILEHGSWCKSFSICGLWV